jgi:hypothetical protein
VVNFNFSALFTFIHTEAKRIGANFVELYQFAMAAIQTGRKALKVTSIAASGLIRATVEVGMFPTAIYAGLSFFANTNNILVAFPIELLKKTAIGGLNFLSKLPVVGGIFTQAVLPSVVIGVLGVLFISNVIQVVSEKNKIFRQAMRQLEQASQDNPAAKQQFDLVNNNILANWQFYLSTVATLTPEEDKKSFAMRFLLSLGVPAFYFGFNCLCGVNPAIALSNSVTLSFVANFVPYGLINALGAVNNAVTKIQQALNPVDHNQVRAQRAAQEALLNQVRAEQQQRQGGHRLDAQQQAAPASNSLPAPLPAPLSSEEAQREELRTKRLEHFLPAAALAQRPEPVIMSRAPAAAGTNPAGTSAQVPPPTPSTNVTPPKI